MPAVVILLLWFGLFTAVFLVNLRVIENTKKMAKFWDALELLHFKVCKLEEEICNTQN